MKKHDSVQGCMVQFKYLIRSKHEKRFTLAALGKGSRYRDYESAFLWLQDSMITNLCFNSTEPNIGLKMNRDNSSFKMYMGDTGLLISHAFDENGIVSEEIYKKLLFGKLEVNEGMIFENIVAQILTANGKKLYFYSNPSRNDKDSRMKIDFLLAKSKTASRHNKSPIEVKSGKNYTLSSPNKFRKKYREQLDVAYVLHLNDLEEKDGILYLPVYMTGLLYVSKKNQRIPLSDSGFQVSFQTEDMNRLQIRVQNHRL